MSAEGWFKRMKSERIRLIDRARAVERYSEELPAMIQGHSQDASPGLIASLVYQSRCLAETLDKQIDEMAEAERRGVIMRANPDRPIWLPLQAVTPLAEVADALGQGDELPHT